MRRREFDDFRRLIHTTSGISLGESKDALLAARVGKRMRALGVSDYTAYLNIVEADDSGTELLTLIDAISTNVTGFFRESQHFDLLAKVVRSAANDGALEVRLWSAACATGEEPYTMAMVALDALEGAPVRLRILATDISGEALDTARRGVYSAERVSKMPARYADRFLKRTGSDWSVSPQLKSHVTFTRINLSRPPFPMSGPFDVIMCRNVMMYFAPETRERLVREMVRLLSGRGLLMLGHAESITGMEVPLKCVSPAAYTRAGS